MKAIVNRIMSLIRLVPQYVERDWYPVLLGVLAALDAFLIFIPTDGIIVISAMASPKQWVRLAVGTSIGSTIGAACLGIATSIWGNGFVSWIAPGIHNSEAWVQGEQWLNTYGSWVLWLWSATPLPQQPMTMLAGLGGVSWFIMALAMLAGRLPKFLIMSYLASHAPKLVRKFKFINEELDKFKSPQDK